MRKIAILLAVILIISVPISLMTNYFRSSRTEQQPIVYDDRKIESVIQLNPDEMKLVEQYRKNGVLNVAMRAVPTVYEDRNGVIVGYPYKLIQRFADYVGVELNIEIVSNISTYFEVDGIVPSDVKKGAMEGYKPDLLSEVDIYCDTITVLPWREELIDFVPMIPIKEVAIHRKGFDLTGVEGLDSLRVSVMPSSSYETLFEEMKEKHSIDYEYVHSKSITDTLVKVSGGEADVTAMDSNRAIVEVQMYDNLEIGIPLDDQKFIGWGIEKGNVHLKTLLTKYIDYMVASGEFDGYWTEVYDVSYKTYIEYLDVIEERFETSTSFMDLDFTAKELAYIETLRETGQLTVATRNTTTVYYEENGEMTGFHYSLFKALADELGVELEVKTVPSVSYYFMKDGVLPSGVKTDDTIVYTPDLIQEVDLYCDSLTLVPWREKLVTFVRLMPVREMVLFNKSIKIETLSDLQGKRIIIGKDTSYEKTLNRIKEEYGYEFEVYYHSDQDYVSEAVAKGEYDLTLRDSNRALEEVSVYDELLIGPPASDLQYLGWVTHKDDKALASIVEKFISYTKSTELFNQYWLGGYDISYYEYVKYLNVVGDR